MGTRLLLLRDSNDARLQYPFHLNANHVWVKIGPHDPERSWAVFGPDAPM
jgi:hypothetical protein